MKVLLVIVASVALAGLSTNLTESKTFAIHFEALRSLTTASSFCVFMLSLAKERDFLLLIEYHMTRLHICKG
jgi:fluoride ion exporter CrcB/FEX